MAKKDKAQAAGEHVKTPIEPRLRARFRDEVHGAIKSQYGVTNPMALPKLDKIVLTVGLGKQLEGTKVKPAAKEQTLKTLAAVSGQKPVMTKARKSVSNFKVRAGYENGAMVTLRGLRMWEFFDRLVNLSIPRIKDFRGLSPKKFDGRGNYHFGITEQAIFPEVDMANATFTHGMNISLIFKNSTDEMSRTCLEQLGFPFTKPEQKK